MAEVIRMPRMSDTMEEGVIIEWHKKVGDKVSAGDILAEVETDKATMELESYQEGTLLYVGVEKGDAVPVDAILAILGEEGEDYKEILEEEKKKAEKDHKKGTADEDTSKEQDEGKSEEEKKQEESSKEEKSEESDADDGGRIKASPLAKKIARENKVEIKKVEGTGDGGRIVKKDVEAYLEKNPAGGEAVTAEEHYEEKSVSQMRKTIARRLSESKFSAPHFYLTTTISMDSAIKARASMNEYSESKISFNDLIIKAVAIALKSHPQVNASWRESKIRYNKHVHIGMAVGMDEGLLVPVIRFADTLTLSQISGTARELAEKAKEKKLQPADWEGNTFTISNLGMFDIDEFTAIINPPDACILAIGTIREEAVVRNGEITIGNNMKVTLSCDHRVVDGVTGSKFLQTFKALLEEPVRLLV